MDNIFSIAKEVAQESGLTIILVEQDVPLPRNEKFLAIDKGYQELVEEKKHGLYTKLAAKARENAKHLESFHQW